MTKERTRVHRAAGLPLTGLRVEVTKGPDAGKVHVARSETITIGTAPENDLVLGDETVSRHHLDLTRRGDRIEVVDNGSTNGTSHGAMLIQRGSISAGATLALGRTNIRVDDGEPLTIELHEGDHFGGLVGRSTEMRSLMARIARGASSDVSCLIVGETGTGKEVVAQALHQASRRAAAPFETVDCGALMPTLIASELFGHEKGAFTGAESTHVGAFERAHGGTLFLDEIGELPPQLQTTLLGVLERRSFRRVGGTTPISVDVRVVCATNRDLRAEVNVGTFRQDLYYRIAVLTLHLPTLRARAGDIPLLIDHFLDEAGFDGNSAEVIPPSQLEVLKKHHWPGNVRELRNYVDAALALGEAPTLDRESFGSVAGDETPPPPRSSRERPPSRVELPPAGLPMIDPSWARALSTMPFAEAKAKLLAEFEQRYIQDLMERNRGNVSGASREAKLNRSHVFVLLKRHGLK